MAALAAAVAAASTAFSTFHLSKPNSLSLNHRKLRTIITCSLSSSTFAPPKPKPQNSVTESFSPDHPWQQTLPDEKKKKTKKKENEISINNGVSTAAKPEYSKAARRFYNENFREPRQRLSKVLAAAGVASRRSCEELIFGERVTVNGSVCNTPQTKVDPAKDMIYVNGNRLPKKLPPKDKSNPGKPKPRLFTVGRLDVATTGLLLVTNDGEFAQELSHPSFGLSKEYIATIEESVSKRQLIAISEGTVIDGILCIPDVVELLPQQADISRSRLRIVVHEGRHHEVRELVKNARLQIYSLKRVRIGGFRLPADLAFGKYMELKEANLKALGWKSDKRGSIAG